MVLLCAILDADLYAKSMVTKSLKEIQIENS